MAEDCKNPSPRLRAVAEAIYAAAARFSWEVSGYGTYEELERKDPIGFEEFNEIVARALEVGDAA